MFKSLQLMIWGLLFSGALCFPNPLETESKGAFLAARTIAVRGGIRRFLQQDLLKPECAEENLEALTARLNRIKLIRKVSLRRDVPAKIQKDYRNETKRLLRIKDDKRRDYNLPVLNISQIAIHRFTAEHQSTLKEMSQKFSNGSITAYTFLYPEEIAYYAYWFHRSK